MEKMQTNDSNGEEKPTFKTLEIGETIYKTILTSKFENRVAWQKPDEKKIYSLLPGTIVKIDAKKGDKIKIGQILLVFEAMKMLNTVKANQAGTLKDIYVKIGDKITKNFLIIEFE